MKTGSTWKHKVRRTQYSVLGLAALQASDLSKLKDGASMVVYVSKTDGSMWIRAESEFGDGRFEEVK